jgi:hypothetical protein
MIARSSSLRHGDYSSEGFPSGQREQTVNLSLLASKVRILPPPPRTGPFNANLKERRLTYEFPEENTKLAGVAQLVELQPSKLDVAGSRPVSRSTTTTPAHLAQLAEHVLGKDEVTRSIRVVGSRLGAQPIEVSGSQSVGTTRFPQVGPKGRIGRWPKRNSYETSHT